MGAEPGCKHGQFIIGDNCTLGANAVIIGPVKIANYIQLGASACVINDCLEGNKVLIGLPAFPTKKK